MNKIMGGFDLLVKLKPGPPRPNKSSTRPPKMLSLFGNIMSSSEASRGAIPNCPAIPSPSIEKLRARFDRGRRRWLDADRELEETKAEACIRYKIESLCFHDGTDMRDGWDTWHRQSGEQKVEEKR